MRVHLLDGTFELFRVYYGAPSRRVDGVEVAAARGVLRAVMRLLEEGATHLGMATDHVIESFRNDLWSGYKTGVGLPADLVAQFPLVEEAVAALGVVVWAMVDLEADDALAAVARRCAAEPRVDQVLVLSPDKDLAQVVRGQRVVQVDRLRGTVRDEEGVRQRFGVGPESIPDLLALVGDSADGFPGLPGWGVRSATAVLARYRHLDAIPADPAIWDVAVRGRARLAATLAEQRDRALLFRRLATLRADAPVEPSDVDALAWGGPRPAIDDVCRRLGAADVPERGRALARQRSSARAHAASAASAASTRSRPMRRASSGVSLMYEGRSPSCQ